MRVRVGVKMRERFMSERGEGWMRGGTGRAGERREGWRTERVKGRISEGDRYVEVTRERIQRKKND